MGMTDLGIDPGSANSAAEFVDLLRRVRVASELSYRQIAQRARAQGVALPISTLATALNRDTMPRQEVVTAMLLACGCSREELAVWLAARRRIVMSAPSTADETESPETSPDTPDAPVARRLNRLPLNRVSLWALVGAIVVAGAGVTWWATDRAREKPAAVPTDSTAAVRVRPLSGPGCLSEHAGSTGYLFIEPCEQAFPTLKVESVAGGAVRFHTFHPEFGEGCMGVDPVADDDRPSDGYCTDVKHQLFTLSDAGGGHLLRNVELGQCLAVRPEAGVRAVVFATCSAEDPAQLFAVDRI